MSDSRQKEPTPPFAIERQEDAQRDGAAPTQIERRRWPRQPEIAREGGVAPPALEPLRFSTRDLAPVDQFAAWQAYLAPLIEIALPDSALPEAGFPADHTAWNLGNMLVVQQSVPPHSYMRSAAKLSQIRSTTGILWSYTRPDMDRGGRGRFAERTREGGIEVFGAPFLEVARRGREPSFYLPRELFSDVTASAEIKSDVVLSGTQTKLLIEYLDSIEAKLSKLDGGDLPHVVQTTRDMILTCVSSSAEYFGPAEQLGSLALMERVRRFVNAI